MAKTDPNLLTQAEYARSRKERGLPGGSREAVRKAVDENRISAFGADRLIDQHLADSQWARNTRTRLSPQANAAPDVPDLLSGASAPASPGAPAAAQTSVQASAPDTGYSTFRARREEAEAQRAEIEVAKLRGAMVMREDVDRAGYEIGRELRDAMESAVNPLGAELASLTTADDCIKVLRRHNRALQDLLVNAYREKIGAPAKPSAGNTP